MIQAVITRLQAIARDIVLIELQAADQQSMPGASPGSHIDLHLPNGLIRQYSLTPTAVVAPHGSTTNCAQAPA